MELKIEKDNWNDDMMFIEDYQLRTDGNLRITPVFDGNDSVMLATFSRFDVDKVVQDFFKLLIQQYGAEKARAIVKSVFDDRVAKLVIKPEVDALKILDELNGANK